MIAQHCEYMPPFNATFRSSPACLGFLATDAFYLPSARVPTAPLLFHTFWAGGLRQPLFLTLKSFLFTQAAGPRNVTEGSQAAELWVWLAAGLPNATATTPLFTSGDLDPNGDIPFTVVASRLATAGAPLPAALACACIRFRLFSLPLALSMLPTELLPASLLAAAAAAPEHRYWTLWRLFSRGGRRGGDRAGSDVARHLLLYLYGGVYIDGDVLLLRDLRPLQHFDWAYRWSVAPWCNTAVMHAARHSPALARILRVALHAGMTRRTRKATKRPGDAVARRSAAALDPGTTGRTGATAARLAIGPEGLRPTSADASGSAAAAAAGAAASAAGLGAWAEGAAEGGAEAEAGLDAGSVFAPSVSPLRRLPWWWATAFHPRHTCRDGGQAAAHASADRLFIFPAQLFDVAWLEKDLFTPGGWEGLPLYGDFLATPGGVPSGASVQDFARGALAYHWHNQWELSVAPGTWARLFSDAMDAFLAGSGPNMYGEVYDVRTACAAAAAAAGRTD